MPEIGAQRKRKAKLIAAMFRLFVTEQFTRSIYVRADTPYMNYCLQQNGSTAHGPGEQGCGQEGYTGSSMGVDTVIDRLDSTWADMIP